MAVKDAEWMTAKIYLYETLTCRSLATTTEPNSKLQKTLLYRKESWYSIDSLRVFAAVAANEVGSAGSAQLASFCSRRCRKKDEMIKKFLRTLLVGLAVAATVQSAQAGSVVIPGTQNVKELLGTNDRGDLLWTARISPYWYLSTKDASGVYTHVEVDATVAGKGGGYASLANNGDVVWYGVDPATQVKNIYHYDAVTRTARALTSSTTTTATMAGLSGFPQIGGNGSTAWLTFVPLCSGCADGAYQIDYFDKPTSQTIRLSATAVASNRIALNRRADAYWFERAADGALELRKFDALTRTTSILTRRLAAALENSAALAVNDSGDVIWTEMIDGPNRTDIFLFNQRTNTVRRITDTLGRKHDIRINAGGDIAWQTESQVWLYDQRSEKAVLINAQSSWGVGLALNDMGELAWTYRPNEIYPEMHLYKRATAGDVRVRPEFYHPSEYGATFSGSGDLFFLSSGVGGIGIVRSTRDFTCN